MSWTSLVERGDVSGQLSNKFGYCLLYTVSIVLLVDKRNSLPLGWIGAFISSKLPRSPVWSYDQEAFESPKEGEIRKFCNKQNHFLFVLKVLSFSILPIIVYCSIVFVAKNNEAYIFVIIVNIRSIA